MAVTENLFYTDYEPKLQHRFQLSLGSDFPAYLVQSAARPSIEGSRKEIDYINTKRYIAGKYSWSTLDVTFNDPIVPSAAQRVYEWFKTHYDFPSGTAGYASDYKRRVKLKLLGPDGTFVEEWELVGTFIQSTNFGELNYGSDDLVTVSATLSYDYAVLNP